jgi:hypothetical protein
MNTLGAKYHSKLSRVEKMTMAAATAAGFPCGVVAWLIRPGDYSVERMGMAAIALAVVFSVLGGLLGSMGLMAKPKATFYMSGVIYLILYFNALSTFPISFVVSWWAAFPIAICISALRENRSKRKLQLGV